ncbi:MAG: A/G-specific adenine glycosylase, partial [Bacteroidales bacterium]|nr:A/G-specific adenine glycosylase [Bacteroidales bacterium]
MAVFADTLISWYEDHKRDLPWRGEPDPYKIWVSEIILQQTRVQQGWDYYLRFIDNFPNVKALADADEERVLKVW